MPNQPGEFHGGFLFQVLPTLVTIIFAIVIITIVVRLVKGGRQWIADNNSPVLNEKVKVVTKRTNVSRYGGGTHSRRGRNVTTYFVTFEFEGGERKEFKVKDEEYGKLVEGDEGYLTFQGSRYQGFDRA
ncbi:DUF2500 domain-containing protein [Proteinivorax hydrogeniformans]|uniref:DUF2500 domain-containing protein n=1 Tax=Proteinivorax hydrogeniformans TaxID=1826727 RepID=A0AAU8HX48_9FIRM